MANRDLWAQTSGPRRHAMKSTAHDSRARS